MAGALPPLRQDLSLYPADADSEGAPAWTLHDPAANRFFRIGWPAFEMLSRWSLGRADRVADAVNAETTLEVTAEEVAEVGRMLEGSQLTEVADAVGNERLHKAHAAGRLSWARWLLEHYLFFRIPLWRPMGMLARLEPRTRWAFHPRFWMGLGVVLLLGLYLVSRQWERFLHAFQAFDPWTGLLGLGLALTFSKVLHEFGHALTAYRHGCRVPSMGVAFLVMWPMLYTDVNESWKLPSRRQRLHVAAAGILTELALAVVATFLWSFLPDGPLRAALFLLATSTWLITLAINASPFMRFDGYFLLSDWLGIDNLHARAFAFGRWWLRERLFALGAPPPEVMPARRVRFLIGFAFATWLYRLLLFLGIALLVYHFFFKLLGIFLMGVELGWFIARPLWQELRQWWQWREAITRRGRGRASLVLLLLLIVLLALPLHSQVQAPAMLTLAARQAIYAPVAGVLESEPPRAGEPVAEGGTLFQLHSPDIQFELDKARLQEQPLRWQQERQSLSDSLRTRAGVLVKQHEQAAAAIGNWQREQARAAVVSPLQGVVLELSDQLNRGGWVAKGEWLALVGRPGGVRVEAYVAEEELQRLQPGRPARFVPESSEWPSLHCRLYEIDRVNLDRMDHPALAKQYGGTIPTGGRGREGLVPLGHVFRVRLDRCDTGESPPFELRGVVHVEGERISPLVRMIRFAYGVLIREAGF